MVSVEWVLSIGFWLYQLIRLISTIEIILGVFILRTTLHLKVGVGIRLVNEVDMSTLDLGISIRVLVLE